MRVLWTDEKTEHLKRLRKAGASQQEMADALGMTRGAIAGKLIRLGLSDKDNRSPPRDRQIRIAR